MQAEKLIEKRVDVLHINSSDVERFWPLVNFMIAEALKYSGGFANAHHIKDYLMPDLPPTNPGNDYGAYKGSAQNHNFVIENVVDVLLNRSSINTNALEGLKVVEIISKIYSKK